VRSIGDYNRDNADAVTAASSMMKTMGIGGGGGGPAARSKKRILRESDGRLKCLHYGCQCFFRPGDAAEDAEDSCRHHAAAPVFHEGSKFWSCCPGQKCLEFEEFLAVPGCVVGRHDPGEAL
jgi:hypothetical protein